MIIIMIIIIIIIIIIMMMMIIILQIHLAFREKYTDSEISGTL